MNPLVYMMLASLGSLQRFALRNSTGWGYNSRYYGCEDYNIEGMINLFDLIAERKWHPTVNSLFSVTKEVDEDGGWMLVATRISEGTQQVRDSPLWDTDDDEVGEDEEGEDEEWDEDEGEEEDEEETDPTEN